MSTKSRQEVIRDCCGIAAHIAETGDYSRGNELDELAYDNGIFVAWDDDYIMVEDDVFYIQ